MKNNKIKGWYKFKMKDKLKKKLKKMGFLKKSSINQWFFCPLATHVLVLSGAFSPKYRWNFPIFQRQKEYEWRLLNLLTVENCNSTSKPGNFSPSSFPSFTKTWKTRTPWQTQHSLVFILPEPPSRVFIDLLHPQSHHTKQL